MSIYNGGILEGNKQQKYKRCIGAAVLLLIVILGVHANSAGHAAERGVGDASARGSWLAPIINSATMFHW